VTIVSLYVFDVVDIMLWWPHSGKGKGI